MKAYLKLLKAKGPSPEFPIEGRLEIGRAAKGWKLVLRKDGKEVPLGVEDAAASRHHASLDFDNDKLMIRDVGSANGTMVNDRPLPGWMKKKGSEPFQLKDSSVIKIGNTEFEIRLETAPSYDEMVKLVKDVRLEEELSRSHPAADVRRLASSFRIILDISEKHSNTDTRVKEIHNRLETLKEYMSDDELSAEVEDLQRRIGAQLYQEELLREPQVWEVKDFCRRFVERWSSRFMR